MPDRPVSAHTRELERLHRLAHRMDSAFRVPVIGMRVGWDSVVGLVPGVGDVLTLGPAAYILLRAHRLGAPRPMLVRMGANIGIDALIGIVPGLGDLFDAAWKANIRNVDLLQRHLDRQAANAAPVDQVEGQLSSHHPTLGGRTDEPQ